MKTVPIIRQMRTPCRVTLITIPLCTTDFSLLNASQHTHGNEAVIWISEAPKPILLDVCKACRLMSGSIIII